MPIKKKSVGLPRMATPHAAKLLTRAQIEQQLDRGMFIDRVRRKVRKYTHPAMRISCEIYEGRKADLIP